MNTPHNASESARLIQDIRQEILKDQTAIKLEDPKLKRLEQEIAKEKAELDKKIAEAKHSKDHIDQIKMGLAHSEQEFRKLQQEIQQMHLGGH